MDTITILIIIFCIIAFILFIGITIFFLVKKNITKNEYEIKEKFTNLSLKSFNKNFKFLESLSKNNEMLATFFERVDKNKKNYDDQLMKLKDKIILLSNNNKKNKFNSSLKITNELLKDIKKCEEMMNRISLFTADATEYSKNVTNILISYKRIFSKIVKFFEFNLQQKYDNTIFKNIIYSLTQMIKDVNELTIKIDNDALLRELNNINDAINDFFVLVVNVYTLDKVRNYLEYQNELVNYSLKKRNNSLSTPELNAIQKNSVYALKQMEDLIVNIKSLDIEKAKKNAIFAIKKIEQAINDLEQTDRINILIQKNMKIINQQINVFAIELKNVVNAIDTILNKFNNKDKEINQLSNKLKNNIKLITLSYESLQNDFKSYDSTNRKDCLNRTKEMSEKLVNYCNDLRNLINLVSVKFKRFIFIITNINEMKFTLCQILMIYEKENTSLNIINNLTNSIKEIENQEKMIYENYEKYSVGVDDFIEKVKLNIQKYIEELIIDLKFKKYFEQLLMFLNKYRNEAKEINNSLFVAEEKYKSGNFQSGLDILIEVLMVIKSSAKKNKIRLN